MSEHGVRQPERRTRPVAQVAGAITNQVRGVNRVVYDISSKPPSTIEWE